MFYCLIVLLLRSLSYICWSNPPRFQLWAVPTGSIQPHEELPTQAVDDICSLRCSNQDAVAAVALETACFTYPGLHDLDEQVNTSKL